MFLGLPWVSHRRYRSDSLLRRTADRPSCGSGQGSPHGLIFRAARLRLMIVSRGLSCILRVSIFISTPVLLCLNCTLRRQQLSAYGRYLLGRLVRAHAERLGVLLNGSVA